MKRTITTAAVLGTLMLACTATDDGGPETSVPTAPFHASLAEAQAAAGVGQYIIIDFYTDW